MNFEIFGDIGSAAGKNRRRECENLTGEPIDPLVVEVMNEVGFDLSQNERKFVNEDMVNEADKIISFKPLEELPDYVQAHKDDIEFWPVPDPRAQSTEFHRNVRDEIDARVTELISR